MPRLAQITGMIADWLGQPPARLHVLNTQADSRGQVTLTLQCRDGGTALISCVCAPPTEAGEDLIVLGDRGAIYHSDPGLGTPALHTNPTEWESHREPVILEALEDTREKGINLVEVRERGQIPLSGSVQAPSAAPERTEEGSRYGVLLVSGSHTHQEDYAEDFAADRRCRVIAVTDEADIDLQRRALNEELAQSLGVPYEADLGRALVRPEVHVVSVCAPPERRGRIAIRCAEAGKHLYLDKPLVPTLKDADALVAAVRRCGVRSHMFSFLTRPWARDAKRLVEGGYLGKLLGIHADTFFAKGQPGTARPPSRREEEYPPRRQQLIEAKRELDNIGVYPITLVRWLTGRPFRTVFGLTANYFFAEHQKHDVEDFGLLACTLDGGLPVTIAAGRCGWTSHPAGGVNRLVLVGSERTLVVDAHRPRLEVYADEAPWTPPPVHPADPMAFWTSTQREVQARPKRTWVPAAAPGPSDAAYFLDCLDAGRESDLNVAEAALATEVLQAAYRSAATGEIVTLPLPR
jgi:predicted dehydrogenase